MKVSRERQSIAATAAFERTAAELGRSSDPATCAALCRRFNAAIDDELAANRRAGAAVACAPGCAYCCHLRVEVFPHEARALLDALHRIAPTEAAAIERRIVANAERIDAMTVAEHRAANLPCAFLRDGRCEAHEVRPSACAVYHSLSRQRCEHAFRNPSDIGTPRNARPASFELQVFGAALIEATRAGCKEAGSGSEQSELHQALRALLTGSNAPLTK